jgi:hypothetical protein
MVWNSLRWALISLRSIWFSLRPIWNPSGASGGWQEEARRPGSGFADGQKMSNRSKFPGTQLRDGFSRLQQIESFESLSFPSQRRSSALSFSCPGICPGYENDTQPIEMSRSAPEMNRVPASFWNARARCDKAGEPSAGRAFFSAAIISPKVRVWPSGRKMGS